MRLWAKIRFAPKARSVGAALLVSAFFQNFNEKSSIKLTERGTLIEVHFEPSNPPLELISAIKHCENIELHIGDGVESEFKGKEIPLDAVVQGKSSTSSTISAEATDKKDSNKEIEQDNILHELEEISKRVYSFSEFKMSVSNWLHINGKAADFLWNSVRAAEHVNPITWSNINKYLDENGIEHSKGSYAYASRIVSKKCNDLSSPLSILAFIEKLVPYLSFDFSKEKSDEEPVKEFAMSSVPNTDALQNALKSLDKTSTVTDRAICVLDAMGFHGDNVNDEQREAMLSIVHLLSSVSQVDDKFLSTIDPIYKLIFSTFVNMFASSHGAVGQVHLKDFLNDLFKFIK